MSSNKLTDTNYLCKRKAFTLAEVLITLGIIGVVAALTLPVIIEHHNKKVVESRLKKVYSTMNQAISMAELDYGERETWFEHLSNKDEQKVWIEKYILPYLKYDKFSEVRLVGASFNAIYFADGSVLVKAPANSRDWFFFGGNIDKCIKSPANPYRDFVGKCAFAFYYNPIYIRNSDWSKTFNTYGSGWIILGDNPEEVLKNNESFGCYAQGRSTHGFCSALIQHNGWKIPDDYPYRVHY